jgi:hypothetical protein
VVELPLVNTNKKSTPNRAPVNAPLGIIQSLAAGFDLVTRHPQLMLLPIALDVFLWLGPHLSAYPIFRMLIELVQAVGAAAMDATSRQQTDLLQTMLEQVGQAFNLFSWLSPALLGVPSLMAGDGALKVPGGTPLVWAVSNALLYLALYVALNLIGLAVSAAYWGMLTGQVRQEPLNLGRIARLWWGLIKIALLFVFVSLLVLIPTLFVGTIVALINLTVAQFVVLMGMSLMLWALFYLVFTIHGVALRGLSVWQAIQASVLLMRTQFPPTMGLMLAAMVIYFGLGFVWSIPASDSWIKAAGIFGHAFVATGLVTATVLYYQNRVPDSTASSQPSAAK